MLASSFFLKSSRSTPVLIYLHWPPQPTSVHVTYKISVMMFKGLHYTHPLLVQGIRRLNCGHACAFQRVDEVVSDGKAFAEKGVDSLLS